MREGKIIGIVSRANLLKGLVAERAGDTGPSDRHGNRYEDVGADVWLRFFGSWRMV
jgi:hypothetical protein